MNPKEIGGYFGLEPSAVNNEYHQDAFRFNLARNALEFILKARNIKTLFVSDYSCHAVFDACNRAGTVIERYDVLNDLVPDKEFIASCGDWIYITNYFGQITNDALLKIRALHSRIIVDNVQAFFEVPVKGVDTIYSCRKFFGVPDGAYLYTSSEFAKLYDSLDLDCSADRYNHIIGRIDRTASDFYSSSRKNEEVLDQCGILQMSLSTRQIMSGINYQLAIERRSENFGILDLRLRKYNQMTLYNNAGLFFYPLRIENGSELRNYLNSQSIYTPAFWPELREQGNYRSKMLTDDIVPIPIDHRYNTGDMNYIADVVETFLKGEQK